MPRPLCIETGFWEKPIPTNRYDASAWLDGREESGPYGFGSTRAEAVADLFEQIDESEPA